jgi:choice-of-anchor B domain-containing protein
MMNRNAPKASGPPALNQATSPFSRRRRSVAARGLWVALPLVLAMVSLLSLLVGFAEQVQAHEQEPPPPLSRLPACQPAATTCSWADLSRRDWGAVRPFPPGDAKRVPLDIDELEVRDDLQPLSDLPCTNRFAGMYPCQNVDLLAFVPLSLMGADEGNTLWGWVDPQTQQEYVIAGVQNGSVFIDISNPTAPRYVGKLPTHTGISLWRDIKVYADHVFIGSDLNGPHGMQVYDLTHLRTLTGTAPVTLTADAHYGGFGASHNLVINSETGFLYAVGSDTCSSGLHMVDIRTPISPTFAGCYSEDGYVHDAQCVVYHGPDARYAGRELCFNSSAASLTVVDVTDKQNPVRLAQTTWQGLGYVHQGWLTADQRYLLLDDELDEKYFFHNARTYVFDMVDLTAPRLMGYHEADNTAIDHNLYISGTLVYQANYASGLRILQMGNLGRARLREVGYFDTYPGSDIPRFTGAWSPYPFFPSGVVAVNTIDRGLFILRPTLVLEPFVDQEVFLPLVGTAPAPEP